MIRKHVAAMFVATLAALVGTACVIQNENNNDNSPTQVTEVKPPTPAPTPSASPTPGGQQGQGPIVACKVNFFVGSPGAGNKTLVVGEKGAITMSPLNAQGQDPCEGIPNSQCTLYSQADAKWTGGTGVGGSCSGTAGPVVASTAWSDETFNRNLEGCKAGDFEVTAVFRDTIPCSLVGKVVPAGAQGTFIEGLGSWGGRFRRFVQSGTVTP